MNDKAKSVREFLLEQTLRIIVSDLFNFPDFDCCCGVDPFVDGEECPICFGLRQCGEFGIELFPPRGEQEEDLP